MRERLLWTASRLNEKGSMQCKVSMKSKTEEIKAILKQNKLPIKREADC